MSKGAGVASASSDPVFIHGILQRSGTNYLFQLLRAHPDLAPGREPIWEDMFLQNSDGLFDFVRGLRSTWNPQWNIPAETDDELLAGIGDALLSFMRTDPEKRLLLKNPRSENLPRFFTLFPRGRPIVLLRDGRSVAQSAMKSFEVELGYAAELWAKGADAIQEFRERCTDESRYLIVRYEDLVVEVRPQLERILDFCELDRRSYDFDEVTNLPIYGSSEFSGDRNYVHWDPVPRDDTFDPLRRWRDWSPEMHDEFWAIAGKQMRMLGYTEGAPMPGGSQGDAAH